MSLFANAKILVGDVTARLADLPSDHFHCVVTSPPYWSLRDYGTASWEGGDATCDHKQETRHQSQGANSQRAGRSNAEAQKNENFRDACGRCGARRIDQQIGLEPTPDQYVARMVEVFREVRRVLREDGVLFLNLGDVYAHAGACGGGSPLSNPTDGRIGDQSPRGRSDDRVAQTKTGGTLTPGLKPKDLVGIPWRVAFALQADGWWLRSDIIWHKPNPMPESVTDRPTKAHEYIFLMTKSARYFYDAEAVKEELSPTASYGGTYQTAHKYEQMGIGKGQSFQPGRQILPDPSGRNLRTVWTIPTQPYSGAHFATYPEELVRRCIRAGTSERGCCAECGKPWERIVDKPKPPRDVYTHRNAPEDGMVHSGSVVDGDWVGHGQKLQNWINENPSRTIGWEPGCKCGAATVPCRVLDPFAGSCTTLVVALDHGCDATGIELNPKYVELAKRRLVVPVEVIADPSPRTASGSSA